MSRPTPPPLAGNRLVLAGAVLYLLEWVAIVAAGVGVPVGAVAGTHDLAAGYVHHADALGWAAGWFGVVLLGRVVLMAGMRSALHRPDRTDAWMDIAVVTMVVSVVLEVIVYVVTAGAAWSLAHGGSLATTGSLDAVAFTMNRTIYGPMGVSLICAAVAMARSARFPVVLTGLAGLAGVAFVVLGLGFVAPRFAGAADALSAAALPLWVWMLWTGVIVWRAAPSSNRDAVAAPVGAPEAPLPA